MPKSKGRGKGAGKGRGKGKQQQEVRPGRSEEETESEKPTQSSASRPSLSQAPIQQPEYSQASKNEQQTKLLTHGTGREEKVALHPSTSSIASSVPQANLQGARDDRRKSDIATKAASQEQKKLPKVSEGIRAEAASKRKIPPRQSVQGMLSRRNI